jgi:hypothetical protein
VVHPLDPLTEAEVALAVAIGRELHPGLEFLTASTNTTHASSYPQDIPLSSPFHLHCIPHLLVLALVLVH